MMATEHVKYNSNRFKKRQKQLNKEEKTNRNNVKKVPIHDFVITGVKQTLNMINNLHSSYSLGNIRVYYAFDRY